MLPPDSPFRNPPASLDPLQKVAIDGLRYAADMIELSAKRLYSHLEFASKLPKSEKLPQGFFPVCFLDGWSIVDNIWRINLLLRSTRGLKRTPDVEVQLRALTVVESFRHGFQHLDRQIGVCANERMPLWGTLGWVFFPNGTMKTGHTFLLIPGALRPGEDSLVNPAGKSIASPLDLVTLTAFGQQIELSDVVRRVSKLMFGLDGGLRKEIQGVPGGAADIFISAQFDPNLPEESS